MYNNYLNQKKYTKIKFTGKVDVIIIKSLA